jgi:hypothetical protein
MSTAWEEPIRRTGRLTVFPTRALIQSSWSQIFARALEEFNRLAAAHRLGVTLARSNTPPHPETDAGANIQVDVADGHARARGLGVDIDQVFSATSLHGLTKVLKRPQRSSLLRVAKCFVFVPARPMVNTPRGPRSAGDPVKLFVMVHEFVHAAGQLDNNEHSPENDPDVFIGPPISTPQVDAGSRPADDRVMVGTGSNARRFPPLVLSARTAGLISANW